MSDPELEVQKTIERHWRAVERERIINIIEQHTYHYAKTHYKGINCMICRIYSQIGYEY